MHLDYYTKGQTLGLLLVVLLISLGSQYYFNGLSSVPAAPSAVPATGAKAVPISFGQGKVVSVSSTAVIVAIAAQDSSAAPLQLTVSQNTKIQEGTPLSQAQGTPLMQDYMMKYMKDGFTAAYPNLFTSTKTISLSSLKVGDIIMFFLSGAIDPASKTAPAALITRVLK